MKESTTKKMIDALSIGKASSGAFYQQELDVTDELEKLRYPVGRFARLNASLDATTRRAHLATIEQLPSTLRALVAGKADAQLDTPYRPGGWTVRQVVHHVPDSHMNAYI